MVASEKEIDQTWLVANLIEDLGQEDPMVCDNIISVPNYDWRVTLGESGKFKYISLEPEREVKLRDIMEAVNALRWGDVIEEITDEAARLFTERPDLQVTVTGHPFPVGHESDLAQAQGEWPVPHHVVVRVGHRILGPAYALFSASGPVVYHDGRVYLDHGARCELEEYARRVAPKGREGGE